MVTNKSYSDISQSRKLAEILPLESADMWYQYTGSSFSINDCPNEKPIYFPMVIRDDVSDKDIPCWSLTALLNVLLEINGIPLTLEKVKAEDGYEGYYYHIEYKDIVLIPYSKNLVDACYEMILKLNELKML